MTIYGTLSEVVVVKAGVHQWFILVLEACDMNSDQSGELFYADDLVQNAESMEELIEKFKNG